MPVDPRAQHGPADTADRKTHEALLDTFPASDPAQAKGQTGARAVPAGELMKDGGAPKPDGAATLTFDYPDRTKAKLAVERAVREAGVDRDHASVAVGGDGGATVVVDAPAIDAERAAEALRKAGGGQR